MLYKLDEEKLTKLERVKNMSPHEFQLLEKDIVQLYKTHLKSTYSINEIMFIGESRAFQAEADLFALDRNGVLYIFEFKRWQSQTRDILQVLRYGQIFGQYDYEDLESFARKQNDVTITKEKSLRTVHQEWFNLKQEEKLEKSRFNHDQVFVLITNSADTDTISAIDYWSKKGINIRCSPFSIYGIKGGKFIQFDFNDPRGALMQDSGTEKFIVNTCVRYCADCWADMIGDGKNGKAMAYGARASSIENISRDSEIYLYHSGTGVIAKGRATSAPEYIKTDGQDECFVDLKFDWAHNDVDWHNLAVTAWEINSQLSSSHKFMNTVFRISDEMALAINGIHRRKLQNSDE